MLLSLESPQWAQLRHSFGSGGNVPGLILALGNVRDLRPGSPSQNGNEINQVLEFKL